MSCIHSRTYTKVIRGVSKEFTNTESFLMKNDIMKEVQNRGKSKNINLDVQTLGCLVISFSKIIWRRREEGKEGGWERKRTQIIAI